MTKYEELLRTDALISHQLDELYQQMLELNLLKIVHPYRYVLHICACHMSQFTIHEHECIRVFVAEDCVYRLGPRWRPSRTHVPIVDGIVGSHLAMWICDAVLRSPRVTHTSYRKFNAYLMRCLFDADLILTQYVNS